MSNYNKALVEVDEILAHLTIEDYKKIPNDLIQAIKKNKDSEYIWNYDETKELKEQDITRETICILSYINMEYLLNKEQKELMEKIHKFNQIKFQDNKQST